MGPALDKGLRALTLAVVAAIALAAILATVWMAGEAYRNADPGWIVGGLGGALLLAVAGRTGRLAGLLAAGVWPAVLAALCLRLGATWALDVPLISDFKDYHDMALGLLNGAPWLQEGRPTGYPLALAATYAAFGVSTSAGEGLGVATGTLGVLALYALATPLVGRRGATAAAWAYALWPANVLSTPVLGTEVPYTTAFLAMMAALIRVGPGLAVGAAWACLAGALTAAAQYVRPTTLALVPAAWAFLARSAPGARAGAMRVLVYTGALLTLLSPVLAFNHAHLGRWSLSTSAYGSWSLLVGMNQRHNGMWNVDDAAVADRLQDRRAIDAWAAEEGRRRLLADPPATLALMGRKFVIMWGAEDFGTYWAYGFRPDADPGVRAMLALISQAFYAALTALAAWALWRQRRWPLGVWPLWVGLLLLVGVHSLLEVQSRYHCYWTPVFMVAAGALASRAAPEA
ncbi:MAG: hypothetical protein VKS61_06985 [Candidatus Sericytochromatia bacterium]|nr:hypothetical protein [Candidatus Sericytochromatia bacterium]